MLTLVEAQARIASRHRFWAPTGRGWASRPADIHLPVVEGTADNGVLPRLQHDIAADKLLHRSLAVRQQAAQRQLVAAAEGGAEDHDAEVQEVAVGCVGAPGEGVSGTSGEKIEASEWGVCEWKLPASFLEESKLQSRPLQHSQGRDRDWSAGFAGEAAL